MSDFTDRIGFTDTLRLHAKYLSKTMIVDDDDISIINDLLDAAADEIDRLRNLDVNNAHPTVRGDDDVDVS